MADTSSNCPWLPEEQAGAPWSCANAFQITGGRPHPGPAPPWASTAGRPAKQCLGLWETNRLQTHLQGHTGHGTHSAHRTFVGLGGWGVSPKPVAAPGFLLTSTQRLQLPKGFDLISQLFKAQRTLVLLFNSGFFSTCFAHGFSHL